MPVSYKVEGMSCEGCASSVEMVLSRLVDRAKVTLTPALAVVEGGKADDLEALNAALAKGGFTLKPANDVAVARP